MIANCLRRVSALRRLFGTPAGFAGTISAGAVKAAVCNTIADRYLRTFVTYFLNPASP